jgi:hypothetical protein
MVTPADRSIARTTGAQTQTRGDVGSVYDICDSAD